MIAYVRGIGSGVVATTAAHGAPQAAYLDLTATDGGELVFNARSDSRKVANIVRDGRVAVVIGGADGTTLQCEGTAVIADGPQLERCATAYAAAFPHVEPVRPGVVLVVVTLSWARHRDYRGAPVSRDVDLAVG
ncbi:pyridoxamine 5'-phosphate oxidase [Microterricola gilva]|uniref:Pyridoxamine 5'-phosphate oxidase n=2 Tax=Microterricola gilva TaxID=393267 RepID=A0A4Q8ARJ5_9MICO|nr:pyridoxamine 5'-phosphate oxidase [Microterricola gilva]